MGRATSVKENTILSAAVNGYAFCPGSMTWEYLLAGGNKNVVLCERGIKTFESEMTRNTLDLAAVALVRELSHLPVVADPSHGTGKRELIAPASRAALAIGADGLIIEVHPCPEKAVSDGAQSLTIEGFRDMMRNLSGYMELWKQERVADLAVV